MNISKVTNIHSSRDNPHAKALENRKTEMEKLQKENEALQERIRLLEKGETEDLTQRVGVKVAAESQKEILGEWVMTFPPFGSPLLSLSLY